MTHYLLHLSNETVLIIVGDDLIIQAPPQLSAFIGRPWAELRQALEATNVVIEPYTNKTKSDYVEFKGEKYEIKWNDSRTAIRRISKHVNGRVYDIQFSSLPLLIRNALC